MVLTAQEITNKLRTRRTIEIEGIVWTYSRVSLWIWDPKRELVKSGLTDEQFAQALKERMVAPSEETLRYVLFKGILDPFLALKPGPNGVWVEDVVQNETIADQLYQAICTFTLEDLVRLKGAETKP